MKRKLFILVFSFVIVLTLYLNVSASTINTNLCEKEDIQVTWSGTWLQAGTEGTNNPGTNLIDGDYTNKWGSNDIRSTKEEWVQITFSKPETIHSFCIYQEPSGAYTNITQYTLQIQNNTDTWETVYTSPEFDEFWTEDAGEFKDPITATAIRFHCVDEKAAPGTNTPTGQCAVELSEIELFQKTEVEDTPSPAPTNTPVKTSVPTPTSTPKIDNSKSPIPVIIAVSAGVIVIAIIAIVIIKLKKNK